MAAARSEAFHRGQLIEAVGFRWITANLTGHYPNDIQALAMPVPDLRESIVAPLFLLARVDSVSFNLISLICMHKGSVRSRPIVFV